MMTRMPVVAMSVVLFLGAAGCAMRAPNIADIHRNPGYYDDRQVVVEGDVTNAWNVLLVPYGVYRVEDGTGGITVVSRDPDERVPPPGARVRVKGPLREIATFGRKSVGLHIEARDVDVRRH